MSILIKGLKMPKDKPLRIVLNPNGQLFVDHGTTFTECEAVELPDHGDLVERDIVWRDMVQTESFQEAQNAIWKAPVVIPAERIEENDRNNHN